jgi:hypothetical protein
MAKIDLTKIKRALYIKLGPGGCWETLCLQDGTLRLGYFEVSHEDGLSANIEGIREVYKNKRGGVATGHSTQVRKFYDAGMDTLWITFSRGLLWWSQAEKEVVFLGQDKEKYKQGSRFKRTIDGWHCKTLTGELLRISELSGMLTRTSGYRQTVCDIDDDALNYLLRRIQGVPNPDVEAVLAAQNDLNHRVSNLIKRLSWQDFELFVDLVFANEGGQRISELGGKQKTIDMELQIPLTKERAIAQIKSSTNQNEFEKYVAEFKLMSADWLFYVYHSSRVPLKNNHPNVIIFDAERLADLAIQAGLIDWIAKMVG